MQQEAENINVIISYRLSFLLFFTTMVLSMWFTNTMACGIMMPLVKEILKELEKVYQLVYLGFSIVKNIWNTDLSEIHAYF